VQSIARRKRATKKAGTLRREKHEFCATLIQAAWRGHAAKGSFIITFVHIIMIQSVLRRKIATAKVQSLRHDVHNFCATLIQAMWRGRHCKATFNRTAADIIIVQCITRRWIACRRRNELSEQKHCKESSAAIIIQARWKAYCVQKVIAYMKLVAQMEASSATKIATSWKRVYHETQYQHFLSSKSCVIRAIF
jgi:myosin heavy subunit